MKPNAEFIYHGEGDKKADFTAADIKRSETQCVYGIFVGDKAVLNAASENINISVTNTEGEARAVYAGAFTDKDKHVINGVTLNLGDDTTKNVTVDGLPSFTVLLFCAQIPTANPSAELASILIFSPLTLKMSR